MKAFKDSTEFTFF